ncbi:MAG: cbb3-type cytochrome c oxidase subunit I [Acidobacteriota bacterium]
MTTSEAPARPGAVSYLEDHGRFGGIFGWIFSTDHKRIGILYLVSTLSFFFVGMSLGFLMRLQMLSPHGELFKNADYYNALFTLHGVIMIFLFIIPAVPGSLGNFFMPIMIGAKDVAFPRLNLLSWWLYVAGAVIALASLFGSGLPDTGWTFYAPYSLRTHADIPMAVFGVFVLGFSSIITGINFITTMHRMRAPGMGWFKMPLFPWALYATSWVQVLATPVLGITMLLIFVERIFHVGIFNPAMGGDPLLYQHLFWMYSHPAVYIMILPAMGLISEMIPTFAHRTIFGYTAIVWSSMGIALLGSLVWAHHMFTSGLSDAAATVFSLLTFLVAVPSAIKVFNWTATLYKGSIALEPPMLYALSFIFLFSVGGLTGLILGALALNVMLHDTYFVVAHFHYVIFGGAAFAFFGALHYWLPKMFGRMYNRSAAYIGWALLFTGFNLLYFTMFVLGVMGMPRRYAFYLPRFQTPHVIATVGSWIMIAGILVVFTNLIVSVFKGEKAGENPWGGVTLEWQIPSPPPTENFLEPPTIPEKAYDFEGAFAT